MRFLTILTSGAFVLALLAAGPASAQVAEASDDEFATIDHMPGDTGATGSAIRINRGSGFAPLPDSSSEPGIVANASRPVTVPDQRPDRVARPVSQHRWGVTGGSRFGSSDRVYIYSDRGYRHRPRYGRYHDRGHKKGSRPAYGTHGKRDFRARGLGNGIFVNTGNVRLRVGF